MAKLCTVIYLHFSPDFAADLANSLIELDAYIKGGIKTDTYWTFGTIPTNDIIAKPPADKNERYHYSAISRLHFTIKWDSLTKNFYILDGGVYPDEKDTSPGGKPVIKPSRNGVWLDGFKMAYGDWELIQPGSLIYLGNGKKIVVRASEYDTLNEEIWLPENWIVKGEKESIVRPVNDAIELAEHSKSNVQPDTLWSVVGRVVDWLLRPSKGKYEYFIKLVVLSLFLTLLINEDIKALVRWVFNR
jgi:hypothetical protein